MSPQMRAIAHRCLEGAESNRMTFPEIVSILSEAGFEGYFVDLRKGLVTYYASGGDSVELAGARPGAPVAADFNPATVREAIHAAQTLVPGYTYKGFIEKVALAGCAGYFASFLGRRVLYFGRSGETHVEYFPKSS